MTVTRAPERRLLYNDDGDTCLSEYRGAFTPAMVTDAVDVLLGTPVTTLVYCVSPSDLVNYPSAVTEMPGWRRTPSHEAGHYRRQYALYQHVRERGWDIPGMVMERAAAANYHAMGADGFYVFNLFCQGYPLQGDQYLILRDVSHPRALARRDKLFMASPDSSLWRRDSDVLPVSLPDADTTARIGLWVGDDLEAHRRDGSLGAAVLRVRVNDLEPDEQLAIGLNGEDLDLVDAQRPGRRQTVARGMHVASWTYEGRELGPNPGIWLECELGANLPRRGDNIVTIRRRQGGCAPVRVVQVELPVRYEYCGRPCSVEEPSL